MAYLHQEFDASQVEPSRPLEALPPGEYIAQIKNSEMKPTKKEDGKYLNLELEVMDGEFKGRMFFERLNLDNPNQMAVDIAYKTLSAICHAAGVMKIKDSNQLHYKPMLVRLDVEKREGYDPQNVVKAYKPLNGTGEGANPVSVASAAGASASRPSWAAKK